MKTRKAFLKVEILRDEISSSEFIKCAMFSILSLSVPRSCAVRSRLERESDERPRGIEFDRSGNDEQKGEKKDDRGRVEEAKGVGV